MVDQGAVSAGNFLTTMLLARTLLPSDYGIYALLFALMLLTNFLNSAVIAYGLSLHGAAGTDAGVREHSSQVARSSANAFWNSPNRS
jgi:hypothetical protein